MNTADDDDRSRRVLVVDDSVDTARMMRLVLKRSGFDVRMAHDGAEALAAAAEFRPRVILLDLTLPDLSGVEVAAALRADPAHDGLRIIAVSGLDDGLPPDFDDQLVKPIDHEALLDRLGGSLR